MTVSGTGSRLYKQVPVRFACMLVVLSLSGSACEPAVGRGRRAWQSPASATPSEPAPPAPAPVFPNAVLMMSKVVVTLVQPRERNEPFYYEARFELKETGGRSGATILAVAISAGNGDVETTGPDCWRDVRVPPGGTLAYFDSGWELLGYCAPYAVSHVDAASFRLIVTFVDDDGR